MLLPGQRPCLWTSKLHLWRKSAFGGVIRWRTAGTSKGPQYFPLSKERTPEGEKTASKYKINPRDGSRRSQHARKQGFSDLVQQQFRQVVDLDFPPWKQKSLWGIQTHDEFDKLMKKFSGKLGKFYNQDYDSGLFDTCQKAFVQSGSLGIRNALKLAFSNFVISTRVTKNELSKIDSISTILHPLEWFPATRAMQRKVILHIGPTNSGKTYHALKRLEGAKSGVFAGPLRLLAHEVFTRFNAKNIPCALVTGEEKRLPPGFDESQPISMRSCTVEMVPLSMKMDVAVIDEIQMIADPGRGWAWTQAFLGLQAKELHLCGEERTESIIRDLCAQMGDELVVHRYKRLSELQTMTKGLNGNLEKLRKGDCIIVFSRLGIHRMKQEIERATGKLCAVVYGSLPPETRAQQAALFNDQDNNYDFLVASDAVGMGLNLSIKRIIFESVNKFNGVEKVQLTIPHLKQIAGRAGRYKTAAQGVEDKVSKPEISTPDINAPDPAPNMGLVTSLFNVNLKVIRHALNQTPPPILQAVILPTDMITQKFAAYFPPNTPFSYIQTHLHELVKVHPRFCLAELSGSKDIADAVQDFRLSIPERITLCAAPIPFSMVGMTAFLRNIAHCIAEQRCGDLLSMTTLNLELLDEPERLGNKAYLNQLEELHRCLVLYLWVSYRFAGLFNSMALAFHVKEMVEDKITRCLASSESQVDFKKRARYMDMLERIETQELEKFQNRKKAAMQLLDNVILEEMGDVHPTPASAPMI